ncbi:MAG: T9SS type A sorting domain-containing protein [Prolixibacteraceae bacterium]|nr:T9SS type A sorting domain-containing protein [Prolixibacteraceae bacterium]
MKYLFFLPIIIFSFSAFAGKVTIRITALPANHPYDQPVYLAGSINGWDPASEAYRLTLNEDQTYSIELETSGAMAFKFTRGGWEMVEKGNGCAEIGNRNLNADNDSIYTATIINWADLCSGGHSPSSTAAENVSIMDEAFYMPQFDRSRRIWIYLPPDYETSDQHYPVLYMHDGQNLFDAATSFAGEWQVDESLNALIEAGAPASIVVGIENGGASRIAEYTPWSNPNYGGGEGEKYVDFLVETLKPAIDARYRTLPDRENTGIAGSSLGGLISWYAGLKHQEVFGKIGVFSPSFWFSDSCYILAAETPQQFDTRFYFVAGGKEGSDNEVVDACESMMSVMQNVGYSAQNMALSVNPDGTHSEWFWRSEFPGCYRWLWGVETNRPEKEAPAFSLYPNPASDSVSIDWPGEAFEVTMFSQEGKTVYQQVHNGNRVVLSMKTLSSGIYLVKCADKNTTHTRKLMVQHP